MYLVMFDSCSMKRSFVDDIGQICSGKSRGQCGQPLGVLGRISIHFDAFHVLNCKKDDKQL